MITAKQFKSDEAALNALVDAFAAEMKAKLQAKREDGFHGWDYLDAMPMIHRKYRQHLRRKNNQWIDVANLAAMLWNAEQAPTGAPHA
jgi:hypothetical protein